MALSKNNRLRRRPRACRCPVSLGAIGRGERPDGGLIARESSSPDRHLAVRPFPMYRRPLPILSWKDHAAGGQPRHQAAFDYAQDLPLCPGLAALVVFPLRCRGSEAIANFFKL